MNKLKFIAEGLLNAPANLLRYRAGWPMKPRVLVLMTTDRCNSRCLQCNIWQQKGTEKPLSVEEIGTALRSPIFQNIKSIINTGGECTLRNDLENILFTESANLPNAELQISTNGLLPNRVIETVKYAKVWQMCLSVGISLDGVNEQHDLARGVKGNFDKVDWLLEHLLENKVDTSVGFVLSENTMNNLSAVRDYLKTYGKIPFVQWCSDGNFYLRTDMPAKDKRRELLAAVKSLSSKEAGSYLMKKSWIKYLEGKSIKFPCFALNSFCVLKSNGDIVPCLSKFNSSIGNIRYDTVENIWHSKTAQAVHEEIKQCSGCLNSWGAGESYYAAFYPYLQYLQSPKELIGAIK
jgi:MoaA/NifB/PqqE/SkfB family radical SAM enzyme